MRSSTKATKPAAQAAAFAAHARRMELHNLGWKTARVRGLSYDATCKLLRDMEAGTVVILPADIDREVEAYLTTVRCHDGCKNHVRQYGYAAYKSKDPNYHFPAHLCEVCAYPMTCSSPDGKHGYVELSQEECRKLGIYHGGNCYHVSKCNHCGDVHAVDSSD